MYFSFEGIICDLYTKMSLKSSFFVYFKYKIVYVTLHVHCVGAGCGCSHIKKESVVQIENEAYSDNNRIHEMAIYICRIR